jgi:hypothetical protein
MYYATLAAVALKLIDINPLPEVAGVHFVDARRTSNMNFGVRMQDCFSMW